jgi:hypothetical protein
MREVKCKKCGARIVENDRNPNVHYSTPQEICWRCKGEEDAPIGAWLQKKKKMALTTKSGNNEKAN